MFPFWMDFSMGPWLQMAVVGAVSFLGWVLAPVGR
jgi:hypothetical protein